MTLPVLPAPRAVSDRCARHPGYLLASCAGCRAVQSRQLEQARGPR